MTTSSRVYAGVAAGQRRNERRDRLITAAFELLASDGTQGLTIRKIAVAAGVSTRYVYEDFVDLEDLRCQAFDQAAEEVATVAVNAAAAISNGDARAQLAGIIGAMFEYCETYPARARLVLTDAFGDPALAARRQQLSALLAQGFSFYVRGYLEQPDGAERIVDLAARAIVGAVAEVATAWVTGALNYERQQLVEDQVDLILGMIRAIPLATG